MKISQKIIKKLGGDCEHYDSRPKVPFSTFHEYELVEYTCGDRSGFFYWSREKENLAETVTVTLMEKQAEIKLVQSNCSSFEREKLTEIVFDCVQRNMKMTQIAKKVKEDLGGKATVLATVSSAWIHKKHVFLSFRYLGKTIYACWSPDA